MVFTPIVKENTFDSAVKAIGEYIVRNRLKSGDSLLAEPELAEKLGISRNILREALRHYRTLGVLSSKPKVGTVICSLVPENPYSGYFPLLASQHEMLPKLAEMRLMIEAGSADILVNHVSSEDIDKLNKICEKFENANDDLVKRIEIDIEFHSSLLSCGDNIFLKGMIPLVVHFFTEQLHDPENKFSKPVTSFEDVCREHRQIVSALAEKEAHILRSLLQIHLHKYKYERKTND